MILQSFEYFCDRCNKKIDKESVQLFEGHQLLHPSRKHTLMGCQLCDSCQRVVAKAMTKVMQIKKK